MKVHMDINEEYDELTIVVKAKRITDEVKEIMEKLQNKKEKTIIGKLNQKMYILNPKEITLFYSNNQKIYADTKEQTFEVKEKLYELEELLKGYSFVRISKFAIANVNEIKNIEMFFNGSLVVNFNNGKQETISRRYVSKVKKFIGLGGK
ncbi:LytTR family DNA-binding domain-containing protein [Clostridium sediminicola]|uniref:LytTR family DNA-binding domain-containing protein n=1 Tax=Clostridium sediminicola TaxID=3114879 RepID=UPI0031F1DBCA